MNYSLWRSQRRHAGGAIAPSFSKANLMCMTAAVNLQWLKVAGNHINEIHDFRKQLNFSKLGYLYRRHFALRFACLPIDIDHGKF